MRMKKRLALLLAAVMLVGLLPTAALAVDGGEGGGEGPNQPGQPGKTIDFNNQPLINGQFQVKDGETLKGTVTVKLDNALAATVESQGEQGNSYNVNVPDGITNVVITLQPENGYSAVLRTGGGAISNIDTYKKEGENGAVTYTIPVSAMFGNGTHVSFAPDFSGSEGGGEGGGEQPEQPGKTIDFNNQPLTNGQLQIKDGETLKGTVTVKLDNALAATVESQGEQGNSYNVNVPDGITNVVITLQPENGYSAVLRTGGGAISNIDTYKKEGENGAVTYTIPVSVMFVNGTHLSFTPDFSNGSGGDEEPNWYTVSWGGGNVTVKNGQVIAERIHWTNESGTAITYTKNSDEVDEDKNIYSADILQDEHDKDGNMTCSSVDKYGFGYGDTDLFIRKGIGGVTIDFKFIPDYGYQLKNIYTNEDQTESCLNDFTTDTEISKFAFAVIAGGNVHFCVSFQAVNNTATLGGSGVSAATVDATGIASGTLNMTVAAQETKDVSATQAGTAVKTLDIKLDNIVSKGGENGNWTTPISEFFDENKAIVSLTIPGLEAGATYKVVREHDNEEPAVLNATYSSGKLTFESDKFSTYTIVKTADAPVYTPTLPPAVTTPTVTVPVSGDADSVKVTATVSGTTATVGSIKASDLDKIADAATEPVDVVIDLSGLDKTVNKATIPNNTFKNVARAASDEESGITGLEVKLTTATVTMDGATLSAVLEQAGSGSVTVAVAPTQTSSLNAEQRDAVQELTAPTVIDAYFQSGAKRIGSFEGGRVKLAVPYVLEPGKLVSVHYVDDEGALTPVEATYSVQDGTVTFFPPHFSYYVISADGVETPCDGGESCPAHAFSDVDTAQWYHEAVDYAIENGLMSGYGDGKFDPNGSLSRGMLCQILYNKEGRPAVTAENPFTDVPADQWYTDAVVWAYGNEIVAGYGDGTFGPDDDITREQLATILYRYEQVVNQGEFTGSWMFLLDFEDADLISDWASEAMHWMVMNGVIAGKGDSILDPLGKAQRCEVAQMLMNYLEK